MSAAVTDVWGTIHAERRALAADLQGLSEPQWATPSLCSGWSIRDVLAHMTSAASMGPPQFIGTFITSGFNFNALQQKGIEANKGGSPRT